MNLTLDPNELARCCEYANYYVRLKRPKLHQAADVWLKGFRLEARVLGYEMNAEGNFRKISKTR